MPTVDRERMLNWAALGLWEGSKWGLVFGVLYALVAVFLIPGDTMLLYIWWLSCFPFISVFFYLIPALGIGSIVGGLVGGIVALPNIYKSTFYRVTTALGISALAVACHLWWLVITGNYEVLMERGSAYPLFHGIYVVLFIMVFWISSRIPTLSRPVAVETVVEERRV